MFNPALFENSRGGGFGVLEIIGGFFKKGGKPEGQPAPVPGARRFAPLKRSKLSGGACGPLASLKLSQTFGYSKEECGLTLEAAYRFPLPGDAAVTSARVRFGEVEIQARLKEREKAEADYEKAVSEGRQAALATREAPDVFTVQVAGIKPDEDIEIEISYVQLARAEGQGWTLRLPLTTAPRYAAAHAAEHSRAAQAQPLATMRDPGHRFALDLELSGAESVESFTHDLATETDGGLLRVTLAEGEVVPDSDLVLSWIPKRQEAEPSLQVWTHDEPGEDWTYFLALAAPPAKPDFAAVPAREALVLVDHSGSMEGAKWEAADWTVKRFLLSLSARDTFNLCLFHSRTRWFQDNDPRDADRGSVQKAIAFLEKYRDSGGTELARTLKEALALDRGTGRRARHVLVITDAQVSDEAAILNLARKEAKQAHRRRISVVCVDASPNSFLVRQLAEIGGGSAKFLTSEPEEEDISTALDEVLAEWAQPVLANLRLEIDRPEAEAAGKTASPASEKGWSAIDLGDLPAGRPVWVAGRVRREGAETLTFRLASDEGQAADRVLGEGDFTRNRSGVKALFGAWKILGLEYVKDSSWQLRREGMEDALKALGLDPRAVFDGLPENETDPRKFRAKVEEVLVRESLAYGLASSETAFIAERQEKGQKIQSTVAVANAQPQGWAGGDMAGGGGGFAAMAMAAPAGGAPQIDACMMDSILDCASGDDDMDELAMLEDVEPAPKMRSLGKARRRSAPPSAPASPGPMFKRQPTQAMPTPPGGAPPPSPPQAPAAPEGGFLSRLLGGGPKKKSAPSSPGKAEMRFAAQMPTQAYDESINPGPLAEASATPAPDWDDEGDDFEAAKPAPGASAKPGAPLFSGAPEWDGKQAVLFDTDNPADAAKLAPGARVSGLKVRYPGGEPKPGSLDGGLVLLIFVGDMASPRAKASLSDLLDQNGERPLNLVRQNGQRVRVVLRDPSGAWRDGAPKLEVILDWR